MLGELTKRYRTIHTGGRERRVRCSLNSMLYLEEKYIPLNEIISSDPQKWGIMTCIELVRAMSCHRRKNRKAVRDRKWNDIRPGAQRLGEEISPEELPQLRAELLDAIFDALPEPGEKAKSNDHAAFDEGHLRAVYVDEAGRPEKEFWDSTLREIDYRLDRYLEAKGIKERPVEVVMMDKDD